MASINIEYDKITGRMEIKVDSLNPLEVAKIGIFITDQAISKIHAMSEEPSKIIKPNVVDINKCATIKN